MFFFFFPQFAEALKSDKNFIDLLRRDAESKKAEEKTDFFFLFHPDVDTLHDYVLGSLNNKQMREVMDHLSACEECARKALEIRRLDKEIAKDLRDWMRSSVSEPKDSSSDEPK
jgi:anti-sigma factor RsiW